MFENRIDQETLPEAIYVHGVGERTQELVYDVLPPIWDRLDTDPDAPNSFFNFVPGLVEQVVRARDLEEKLDRLAAGIEQAMDSFDYN